MKEKVDVILFCGQSNMQGQAEKLTTDNDAIENAYEYRFLEDSLVPLKNPVGEDIGFDGKEGNMEGGFWDRMRNNSLYRSFEGKTNLVPKFCEAYIKETHIKTIAIHCAKGATRIEFWLPHTNCFDMTVRKSQSAINKIQLNYDIRNFYLVWLQGESNQICGTSREAYKALLKEIKNAFYQELHLDGFFIIKVGNFTNDEKAKEIILAQEEICKESPDFHMLTEIVGELLKDKDYTNQEYEGHLNSDGLELLGKIAGEQLGLYAKNGNKKE